MTGSSSHYALVTAAHHLLVAALPIRWPSSWAALDAFLSDAIGLQLSAVQVDAVLLRTLSIFDRHGADLRPTLIEAYLRELDDYPDPLTRFRQQVQRLIERHPVENSDIQRALEMIRADFPRTGLTTRAMAERLGLPQGAFATLFLEYTGLYPSQYLRHLRLYRAAELLSTTEQSIKEIWASVGFNHASNFVHDFEARFKMSPSDYRRLTSSGGILRSKIRSGISGRAKGTNRIRQSAGLLVVDDDKGTRDTVSRYLHLEGFQVTVAASGQECLNSVQSAGTGAILLDYRLPDMSGLECIRRLRDRGVTAAVVLFSADWEIEELAPDLRSLGATTLSKLCGLDDIKRALSERA